jgi:hypothetical protein
MRALRCHVSSLPRPCLALSDARARDGLTLPLSDVKTVDAADEAAKALKKWEANEYMKVDLSECSSRTTMARSSSTSSVRRPGRERHGSQRRPGSHRSDPTGGLSLVGGVLGGGAGRGVISEFFHGGAPSASALSHVFAPRCSCTAHQSRNDVEA